MIDRLPPDMLDISALFLTLMRAGTIRLARVASLLLGGRQTFANQA